MNKGEMWLAELPSSEHHEQYGIRPVIILADISPSTSIVIPITSNMSSLKYSFTTELFPSGKNGLKNISVALIFQLRALDTHRIKHKFGDLEKIKLDEINALLKELFCL